MGKFESFVQVVIPFFSRVVLEGGHETIAHEVDISLGGFSGELKVIGQFPGIGKPFLAYLHVKPDKALENQKISHAAPLKVLNGVSVKRFFSTGLRAGVSWIADKVPRFTFVRSGGDIAQKT